MRVGARAAWGRAALVVAVLGLAALLVVIDRRPPPPVGFDADPAEYSAHRARLHLEEIAAAPHAVGQRGHGRVRDHIIGALDRLGVEVHVQAATLDGRETVYNVVGRVPGRDSTGMVVVAAHYDSVANAPGATDDGMAAAAMLDVARAVVEGPPLRNDVVFLFTDGEEQGLWGAEAFVERHRWADRVGFLMNYEAAGGGGSLVLLDADGGGGDLIRTYADVAPEPVSTSLLPEFMEAQDLGRNDFVHFRTLGMPGLDFVSSAGNGGARHTPADRVARVDGATLQHHGSNMLALARHYGEQDLADEPAEGDPVWIGVFAWLFLVYPTSVAWLLALLVVGGFVTCVVLALRRGARPVAMARAAAMVVVSVLAAVVGVSLLLGVIQLVRPDHADFFNGVLPRSDLPGAGVPGSDPYWWALMGFAATTAMVVTRWRRGRPVETVVGALAPTVILALLTTAGPTGTSYLFTLPLLGAIAGTLVWLSWMDAGLDRWGGALVVAGAGVPTVLVGTGLVVDFRFVMVPNAAFVAAFVPLFVSMLGLQIAVVSRAWAPAVIVLVGAASAILLVGGLVTARPDPDRALEDWAGPAADPVVASEPVDELSADRWRVTALDFAGGRTCLEATSEGRGVTWCPLPEDVAVPLDLQQAAADDVPIVFGGVGDRAASVEVETPEGVVEATPVRVAGIRGRVFAAVLPSDAEEVVGVTALGPDGEDLGSAPGFDVLDEPTRVRTEPFPGDVGEPTTAESAGALTGW